MRFRQWSVMFITIFTPFQQAFLTSKLCKIKLARKKITRRNKIFKRQGAVERGLIAGSEIQPLSPCVIWDKPLSLSEPQFPHLQNKGCGLNQWFSTGWNIRTTQGTFGGCRCPGLTGMGYHCLWMSQGPFYIFYCLIPWKVWNLSMRIWVRIYWRHPSSLLNSKINKTRKWKLSVYYLQSTKLDPLGVPALKHLTVCQLGGHVPK